MLSKPTDTQNVQLFIHMTPTRNYLCVGAKIVLEGFLLGTHDRYLDICPAHTC